MKKGDKKPTIEAIHVEEAAKLLAIWNRCQPKSQQAFGLEFDIGSQGMVWQYLHATSPLNLEAAAKFATGLGCSIAEFSPRLAALLPPTAAPMLGAIRIPVLDLNPHAGVGAEPDDHPAVRDYLEVMESWVRHTLHVRPEALRVLPARGDSMAPTIHDGDLLFVDTSVTHFDEEGIFIIVWNGALLVKRLVADFSNRHIEIRSDNATAYPPKSVTPARMDELSIRGKVRAWWSLKRH